MAILVSAMGSCASRTTSDEAGRPKGWNKSFMTTCAGTTCRKGQAPVSRLQDDASVARAEKGLHDDNCSAVSIGYHKY
jgi:hypothetical protein